MGQSLMKLTSGGEEKSDKEIEATLTSCYDKYFADKTADYEFDDFYHAISQTIEEINKRFNSTQFRVPDKSKLNEVYEKHYKDKPHVKKEEFQKMLQEVIMKSGVSGFESIKDLLLFIFGIPAAALFVKQGVAPTAVRNDVFIPGVTSATVYLLAKLHKI